MSGGVGKTRVGRGVVVLTALLLIVALGFFGLYLAANANHDCAHEDDCVVCAVIEGCKRLIGTDTTAEACTVAAIQSATVVVLLLWLFASSSLTNLKIKLNN